MPEVVNHHRVSREGLAVLSSPRDDLLVLEAAVEAGAETETGTESVAATTTAEPLNATQLSFQSSAGGFTEYQRSLQITPLPDSQEFEVTERISFKLSIPVWGPLLSLLAKREFRKSYAPAETKRIWWLPAQRMNRRSAYIIGVLSVMSVLTGYLGTLLSQTLTYVADTFEADKGIQGVVLSVARLGTLLSLAVSIMADRRGRKFILGLSFPTAFALTALAALAFNIWSFAAAQTLARGLTVAVALLIGVIAAEEMPAGGRAYGVSVLSMSAALGSGIMVLCLPLADLGIQSWRILFGIPLLALPAVIWLLRQLPETWRFEVASQTDGELLAPAAVPAVSDPAAAAAAAPDSDKLSLSENQRLLLLGASWFLALLFLTPASQFLNEFLRDERDFSGFEISAYQLLTNTPAGISLYLAGRWSDFRGRRRIAILAFAGLSALTVLRYSSVGWALWGFGLASNIFSSAIVPTLGVYGPELFRTARRARHNGIISVIGVSGSALGVLLIGFLTENWLSFGSAFAVLSFAPLLVAVLLIFFFPETASQELEDLSDS